MSEVLQPKSALSRHESYFYDLWRKHAFGISESMAVSELAGISVVLRELADDGVTLPDGSNFVMYNSLSKAVCVDQKEDAITTTIIDNIDAITQIRHKPDGFEIAGASRKFIWGVEIQLASQPYCALGMGQDRLVYSYKKRVGQGAAEVFESPIANSYQMAAINLSMFINPHMFNTQI